MAGLYPRRRRQGPKCLVMTIFRSYWSLALVAWTFAAINNEVFRAMFGLFFCSESKKTDNSCNSRPQRGGGYFDNMAFQARQHLLSGTLPGARQRGAGRVCDR